MDAQRNEEAGTVVAEQYHDSEQDGEEAGGGVAVVVVVDHKWKADGVQIDGAWSLRF